MSERDLATIVDRVAEAIWNPDLGPWMTAHPVSKCAMKEALLPIVTATIAALDAAEGGGEREWQHARWTNPHPAVVEPGSVVEVVRATGKPGATCAACGEVLVERVPLFTEGGGDRGE